MMKYHIINNASPSVGEVCTDVGSINTMSRTISNFKLLVGKI